MPFSSLVYLSVVSMRPVDMKILMYSFLITIRQVLFLSLTVFVSIALLVILSASHNTLQSLVMNFALATGFICVLITSFALQPEDTNKVELMAAMPKPFWKTTFLIVILCWLVVWLTSVLVALAATLILGLFDFSIIPLLIIGYAVVMFFFGGITFLSIVLGRDSRIGLMVGLLAILWLFAFPGILSRVSPMPYMPIFNISVDRDNLISWGTYRLVYLLIGSILSWVGLLKLQNTDFILLGATRRSVQLTPVSNRLKQQNFKFSPQSGILSKPLSITVSRRFGLIVYEGIISVMKGPLFIATAVAWLIVDCIVFIGGLQSGGWRPAMAEGAVGLIFTLRLFLAVLFPFVLVIVAAADKRTHVDQLMLSLMPPRVYLDGKLLGILSGVLISLLICSLPTSLFMLFAVLMGQPIFFIGYLENLFLSAIPFLAYIVTISVLIGMLSRSGFPLLWGGLVALGVFVAFMYTANSIIGNIVFPSGQMVANAITYAIYDQGALSGVVSYNPEYFMRVPASYLVLPILSAIIQIAVMWFIGGKIYERQVKSA